MANALLKNYRNTQQELQHLLSQFSQEQFNTSPGPDRWSAAQVAQHLLKASVLKALYGPVQEATRPADAHINRIREVFLNFSTKFKSPAFILPNEEPQEKEALLLQLKQMASETEEAIKTLDLTPICLQCPKELGELTRLELLWFTVFHTQRHIHQLKEIWEQVQTEQKVRV